MKELNYLFLSVVIFSIIACGGEKDKSATTKDIGSTNIKKFNSDDIVNECDYIEYELYVLTELNELRNNSEVSDANEMDPKSKETAKSLLYEYYYAYKFQLNNEEIDWGGKSKCEKFKDYLKVYQDRYLRRFYKDMQDEIEESEETVDEEMYGDEDSGDWEPPGGDMERYMDLKEEGYSHEEAVEIMEEE